jgi:hypothetical protein
MQDLAWTQGSDLPEPDLLVMHPILLNLPNKVVHFLLDYRRLSPGLGLPASASCIRWQSFLHPMASIDSLHLHNSNRPWYGWWIFLTCHVPSSCSAVTIGHRAWRGEQCIHATPFEDETPTLVRCHICMYFVCICVYLLVSVYMIHVFARIGKLEMGTTFFFITAGLRLFHPAAAPLSRNLNLCRLQPVN